MKEAKRRKMRLGVYPRHILLRVKPETFHELHLRAARNNRSLNFDMNELIKHALTNEKAATVSG